jgi:hypothetical protein
MRNKSGFQFIIGFILGAFIFGGSIAYAAGIIAQPKTADVVIDGKTVDLKGYIIEDTHYFQLRDLSDKLTPGNKDFSIVWDGKNNRILIDTSKGYNANEQAQSVIPTPTQGKTGYGYTFSPLKTGDVVKTSPVESSAGSVGGDYTILKGMEDTPWKTADGKVWPDVPLPAWQSEWDNYPKITFPDQPPVRFTGDVRGASYDTLYVFNPYEVERMIRTIYIYAKQNPSLWQNRDPSSNIPNFSIQVIFESDMSYNTFFPWRDWEIEKFVTSTGGGTVIRIYAYDSYNNGMFNDTEYFLK